MEQHGTLYNHIKMIAPRYFLPVPPLCLLAACLWSASVHAAPVVFGKPTTIKDEHDVLTTGTLDRAVNLGGTDQTVNGVLFRTANIGSGSDSVSFDLTTVAASADTVIALNGSPTFAGEGEPSISLAKPYRELLASAAYNTSTSGTLTMTLSGLKKGTAYTVQLFVSDSRDVGGGGRKEVVSSGGATSDELSFTNTGLAGGVGQFVTATFTADATSQDFVFAPVRPGVDDAQINAFQLRVTTPPAGAATPGTKGRLSTPIPPKGR